MRFSFLGFLFLFLAASCGNNTPTDPGETVLPAQAAISTPISFQTGDGFTIAGTWFTPTQQTTPRPVVILLHAFNQNHTQWFAWTPDFVVENGYLALAFDIRGHGASTFQNGQPLPLAEFSLDDINAMPQDVEAAIAWVKTRPEADPTRIAVIGTDIGANIAFISSGSYPEVRTAVSISPEYRENQASQTLVGTNIPGFQPHTMLFLASFGDRYAFTSSQTMAQLTQGEARVVGLQGIAHGLDLLNDTEAWNELVNWLEAHL